MLSKLVNPTQIVVTSPVVSVLFFSFPCALSLHLWCFISSQFSREASPHSQDDPLGIKQNQPNEKEFIKGQETDYFGFSGLFYTENIGDSSFFLPAFCSNSIIKIISMYEILSRSNFVRDLSVSEYRQVVMRSVRPISMS